MFLRDKRAGLHKLIDNLKTNHVNFHAMAKPMGSACNLDCAYCYYLHKASLPNGPGSGRMPDDVLEAFISGYIEAVTGDEVVFSWQGGEPTLSGLDFFQRVVELEARYAKPGQVIQNDLQTNGTLITEEWGRFLKANRFLVGLSVDGPRELHDHYRVTKDGRPTFDAVMNTVDILRRHAIPFNTLTCVSRFNARRPLDVYRFLRREVRSTRLQFIPVVEYKGYDRLAPPPWKDVPMPREDDPEARPGAKDSIVTDWSVDPDDWGYFLCKVFDEWRNRDIGKVFVNQVETLVAQHLGLPAQVCVYHEWCGTGVAVEQDGSVYACDHYVYPAYRLGNLKDSPIGELVCSAAQARFGNAKSAALPRKCRQCPYLKDCWGECPKNRILRTAEGEPGLNYLCRGFRCYFAHALPEVDRIALKIRAQPGTSPNRM